MRSGFGGLRRDTSQYRGELSLLDRQVRALGTTLRYTLAGTTIFGTISTVRNLSAVQEQLGLISAISPTAFNGIALVGDRLTQLGEQAEDAAYRALTPVSEFNEGLVNLVSTVQNVPENEVVPILEQIAQTARLSLTPVDEATKGITGMLVAFGRAPNLDNVQRFLAEYQRLIFTVPGGAAAGPQIIQQLPQLAAVSRLAAVNPEQMFALLNTVLRAGGTPSTSARGLQYLIQGLAQPPSAQAKKALASIGITPEFTQRQGGVASLFRLIQEVKRRGVSGNTTALRGMSPELLDQLEGVAGPDQLAGLGISGAGAEFARQAVGRVHGVRSLVLLAAQQDQAISDLQAMTELGNNHAEQIKELHDSWRRYADRAQLRQASIAFDQMALDVAQVFEPLFNFGARGIGELRDIVDAHPGAAAGAGGGIIAALLAGRGLGRGAGGLLRGFGGVQAIQDIAATTGGAERVRGDSPTNPVWVAIVYSLSGSGIAGGLGRRGPGPIGLPPDDMRNPGNAGRLGRASRLRLLSGLGAAGFTGLAGAIGVEQYIELQKQWAIEHRTKAEPTRLLDYLQAQTGGVALPGGLMGTAGFGKSFRLFGHKRDLTADEMNIMNRLKAGYINEASAERMLRRVGSEEHLRGAGVQRISGRAEVTVNIDTPQGRITRTVPLGLFSDFTSPAPTTRGKPKTYRGR